MLVKSGFEKYWKSRLFSWLVIFVLLFLPRDVDQKHLMRIQSKNTAFKSLGRTSECLRGLRWSNKTEYPKNIHMD